MSWISWCKVGGIRPPRRSPFRELLEGLASVSRVLITDKSASYGTTKREVLPRVAHRQHQRLNNRAENSHRPTRQRQRRKGRFTSPGSAQRFLATYGSIANHFRPRRHRLSADGYRQARDQRFATWREVTGPFTAA